MTRLQTEPDTFQQRTRNAFATEPQHPCRQSLQREIVESNYNYAILHILLKNSPLSQAPWTCSGFTMEQVFPVPFSATLRYVYVRCLDDTSITAKAGTLSVASDCSALFITLSLSSTFLVQPLPSGATPPSLSLGTSSASSDIIIILEISLGSWVFVSCLILVVSLTHCHDLVY